MAIVLTKDFDGLIDEFDGMSSNMDYSEATVYFEESKGSSFTKMNDALNEIHNAYNSLNDLCEATSHYLNRVRNNFESCEVNNSVEIITKE